MAREHLLLLALAIVAWLIALAIAKIVELFQRYDPKCKICKGAGTVTNFTPDGRKIDPTRHFIRTCEACNGEGEVI